MKGFKVKKLLEHWQMNSLWTQNTTQKVQSRRIEDDNEGSLMLALVNEIPFILDLPS